MDRLTAKLVNRLTDKLVNGSTAKLMNRLTATLVLVNLVKLHLTKFNQLPRLSGRWVPGASTMASQPLDRKLPPWLAHPSNPAMSPHSKPKGLSELTQPELRAGGSPGPELPKSRGTLQGQLGKETDTQENTCQGRRLATPTIVLTGV